MSRFVSGTRSILFFAVFFFILLNGLECGSKRGAEIVVQKNDGGQLHGELIAVKKTSLLLLETESGRDVSVGVNAIEIVHILKGPKTGLGAISGFLVGGAVGMAATGKNKDCGQCPDSSGRSILGGALLGGVGALIGSASRGSNEIIVLKGLPQEELDARLEEIRSKARIKDIS